jgi:hypothetical protein
MLSRKIAARILSVLAFATAWTAASGIAFCALPLCSNAACTLTPDYTFAVGSADFSDPDSDAESGSACRWLVNGVPQGAASPVAEGLLLHFDGTASGANGELPAVSQGASFTSGKWGQALSLGAGGRLGFARPDNLDLSEGSMELWTALRADGSDPVYGTDPQVLIYYEAPNGDTLYIAQSATSGILYAGGTVNGQWQSAYGSGGNMRSWRAGQWHHLCFSYSAAGSFMRFYVDGVLAADTNEGRYVAPSAGGTQVFIGGPSWSQPALYDLDEVRLSGRVPSAQEVAARARRIDASRSNEVWLPASALAPGDSLAYEFTPRAAGENGLPCLSAPFNYPGIPIANPQPPSTLLPPGSTTVSLTVSTLENTSCAYSVGLPLPFAQMTPFDSGAGGTLHQTLVAGLNPDPLEVNQVYVRQAAHPDFVLSLLYRSLSDVNPSYPRTGNLWGWWNFLDDGLPYIARIDLWLGADFSPDQVCGLRQLNPDILILTSINAVENSGLSDDYYLKDVNGNRIEVWPGSYRLNLTKTYVAEYQARYAYQRVLDSGMMLDGVFFDNVMTTQSWLTRDIYGNPVAIDADGDGLADDPAVLDAAWKAGVFHELQTFRALMPNAVVSSHSTNIYEPGIAEIFNGNSLGFVTANVLEGETPFLGLWTLYNDWMALSRKPAVTMLESSPIDQFAYGYDYSPWSRCPASTIEFARTFYPWMRFGLALALMSDGYFAQEWGDTWHGNDWWYDELDFDLGFPLGPAERVDLGGGPGPNGVENPGFESPLAFPWGFWANAAAGCAATVARDTSTAAEGTASARIDITATSGVPWHIEFCQYDRSLGQGVRYDVTFFARSDHPRVIGLSSQKDAPPWTNYGLSGSVLLETAWKEYTVSFEANATVNDARLQFFVGGETGTVWIDNVRLTLHPPDVFRREFENGLVLLNGTGEAQQVVPGPGYRRLTGSQASAVQSVLDDAGPGFAVTGAWSTVTCDSGEWQAAGPFYHDWGESLHELAAGQGEARWEVPVPAADTYTISAWWPAAPDASGRDRAVLYEVVSGGSTLASATLDQSQGGDEWHAIGQAFLSPADMPYVKMTCGGGAPCVADALYVFSEARYNDGSDASSVVLQPLDGIILEKTGSGGPLSADAGRDVTLCRGESAGLGGIPPASGGSTPYLYSWDPGTWLDGAALPHPTATPDTDMTYTLTVTDSLGATAQDSVSVVVLDNDPPVDVGNSLVLRAGGPDINLSWAGTGSYGYDLLTSEERDFSNPQTLLSEIPGETAVHGNGLPPDDGITMRFYRVRTLGCRH